MTTARKTKKCAQCPELLNKGNKNGLCQKHYQEARHQSQRELDDRIVAASVEGVAPKDVAAALGCPVSRVYKATSRHTVFEMPTRRLADIVQAAAAGARLTVEQVTGKGRVTAQVLARQAVCLIGMEAGHSSTAVGALLGQRDHTTVLSNRIAAVERARRTPEYRIYLDGVRASSGIDPQAYAASEQCGTIFGPRVRQRVLKPKNDFRPRARSDEDNGHQFHRGIAAGSRKLLSAILAARAM